MLIYNLINIYLNHIKTLGKQQQKLLDHINQPVHIQDLVVQLKFDATFGEAQNHSDPIEGTTPTLPRLQAHIASLFQFANEQHRANYCEKNEQGQYHLKQDKKNHITRLSTHEFSFYTKQPLSIEEFQKLLQKVSQLAKTLEPNVHILLSTFAVKDPNGKLLNLSLFIEGGSPPIIHPIAKNTSSNVDIDYEKKHPLFSQQKQGNKPSFHANFIANKDITISNDSVFEIKTQGGARYTQAVDICFDHATEHSKQLMLRSLATQHPEQIFPSQMEYCVSSNTTYIHDYLTMTETVLHVDPYVLYPNAQTGSSMLSEETKKRIIPKEYPTMNINKNVTGYAVISPPFGPNYDIVVLPERRAGLPKPLFEKKIAEHNDRALTKQLVAWIARLNKKDDAALGHAMKHLDRVPFYINQLEKRLIKKCSPTLGEYFFNLINPNKKSAKRIIMNRFSFIKKELSKNPRESLFLLPCWKKDLLHRLAISVGDPLNQQLAQEINDQLNLLETEIQCHLELPTESNPEAPVIENIKNID